MSLFKSIRFRLTVLYSTLLFALATTALAITYLAVARSTDPRPVEELQGYVKDMGVKSYMTVADVSQIEAAVNYQTLQTLRTYSLIALGGLFIASLGIGWVLSGRALRPVGAIARTTREIQATDLSRRIRLPGPRDELRDLADTIDSMLDRLDRAFQSQRQLIDDASHELRSPLAIIRTHLDATLTVAEATPEERDRAVAVVDRATTRMSRLVEDLLATARRDADAMTDTDVDLSLLAAEAGEDSTPFRFRYALGAGLHLIGDADALRRAVGNLLSNAVRLAPPSSTVTIATGRAGSWLWLAVADEGPGIAAADLPRVFDRFWRGAPVAREGAPASGVLEGTAGPGVLEGTAGPGVLEGAAGSASAPRSRERRTGLGLAIVRQIVESHGGHVAAFSTLGEGSTFILWLPATDRTDDTPPPPANPAA